MQMPALSSIAAFAGTCALLEAVAAPPAQLRSFDLSVTKRVCAHILDRVSIERAKLGLFPLSKVADQAAVEANHFAAAASRLLYLQTEKALSSGEAEDAKRSADKILQLPPVEVQYAVDQCTQNVKAQIQKGVHGASEVESARAHAQVTLRFYRPHERR